ncbi:cyclodeaminase [Varunaivibrio sulfuroxidans]|uniref:Ornithine cyclodeaminase n=1 Tax=Varunaivibrio sulfuroxidans TaxID=1773489 RepID=A0A4R3J5F4_9PROT|nr:cyclodeaminase [Varunaivibrio sulfuroxidans]TCS60545.1 ornithine cyclodeaminase [Varunaivibrio sulfuroxidans]WES30035.1 cyclodeaminase [Varunaivibrio sulfuroxidans]
MSEAVILSESELRLAVGLDLETVAIVEDAFVRLSSEESVTPPVLSMAIAEKNGELDVKTAYLSGLDGFAVKISPGFFDNPAKGLPSLNGLMVLLSAETGVVRAVLLDNGYLTAVRTAAAGAVAAKHLAPLRVETVGVLGAGAQARLQIEALKLVRDFKRVRVWARDEAKARAFAREMTAHLAVEVAACRAPDDVVRAAEVVVSTTPSRTPLIDVGMLHPGLHITAMGSDAANKNEIAPAVIAAADRYVPDSFTQCARLGELHHAIEDGSILETQHFDALGDVISGEKPGRSCEEEITIVDLTGTGAQDTAIADFAYRRCQARSGAQQTHL